MKFKTKFNPHKIKELLSERKLNDNKFTQVAFLKEVDLSLPGLNNILEGKSAPNVITLGKIADYFGEDMNCFFIDDSKQTKSTKTSNLVSAPVEVYEPPTELKDCYKIMFEQQKEITDLTREVEQLKNGHAPMNGAKAG